MRNSNQNFVSMISCYCILTSSEAWLHSFQLLPSLAHFRYQRSQTRTFFLDCSNEHLNFRRYFNQRTMQSNTCFCSDVSRIHYGFRCNKGPMYGQRSRRSLSRRQINIFNNPRQEDDEFKKNIEIKNRKRNYSIDAKTQLDKKSLMKSTASTFSTAVCIVPPDDVWDTIQRARHLAHDTSFYKWPPAIRLFHPFALKSKIPSLVGKLAEWIDEKQNNHDQPMREIIESGDYLEGSCFYSTILKPFEVTLDSILILPHWEILDARIVALEECLPEDTFIDSLADKEYRRKKEKNVMLIEEEVQKGLMRKRERGIKDQIRKLKKELKQKTKEKELGFDVKDIDEIETALKVIQNELDQLSSNELIVPVDRNLQNIKDTAEKTKSYDGPCVIYLSPNDASRAKLELLRETLRKELFLGYDAFSPSSSLSPYPEQLPRKAFSASSQQISNPQVGFRPLLPIARFATVAEAVKMAKVLQEVWEPLAFNVTDIQFVSRIDVAPLDHNSAVFMRGTGFGVGDRGITETIHRQKPFSSKPDYRTVSTSGEVGDVSSQGKYGCDAMVMLWGEEPKEDLIEEDASLSMLVMDDEDEHISSFNSSMVNNLTVMNKTSREVQSGSIDTSQVMQFGSSINYDELFSIAEREYQRMRSHEVLSVATFSGSLPMPSEGIDIETWLDTDDEGAEDEGATVVVGRAQFYMGAMRDFIGMPASSALDSKDRGTDDISTGVRRKGSVYKSSDSRNAGDEGRNN